MQYLDAKETLKKYIERALLCGESEKAGKYDYVRERYIDGDKVCEIAADMEVGEQEIYRILRSHPAQNELDKQTHKKAREDFENAELSRIVKLNRKETMRKLEDEPQEIEIKEHCQIEKVFGDREAIASGKVTERQEITGGIETNPALREEYLRRQLELLERAKQVGTAIATE